MAGKGHRVPAARQDDLVVEGFLDEVLRLRPAAEQGSLFKPHRGPRLAELRWANDRCRACPGTGERAGDPGERGDGVDGSQSPVEGEIAQRAGHIAGHATHLLAAGGDADIGLGGENLAHPAGGALDRHAVRSPSPDVPISERMLGPAGLHAVQPRIGVCEEMLC